MLQTCCDVQAVLMPIEMKGASCVFFHRRPKSAHVKKPRVAHDREKELEKSSEQRMIEASPVTRAGTEPGTAAAVLLPSSFLSDIRLPATRQKVQPRVAPPGCKTLGKPLDSDQSIETP